MIEYEIRISTGITDQTWTIGSRDKGFSHLVARHPINKTWFQWSIARLNSTPALTKAIQATQLY